MKFILLASLLFTFSQANAASFLTENQADTVLEGIDNICGDTWCEGDFNYSFDEIICSSETESCEFTFDYIYEEWNEETDEVDEFGRATATCTLEGISKYEDMINTDSRWTDLNDSFYDKVSDCITDKEDIAYDTIDMGY